MVQMLQNIDESHADDAEIEWPVVQRTVSAASAPPQQPKHACSVFDLAQNPVDWRRLLVDARPPMGYRIERKLGLTRHITVPVCETAAWQAHEAARRARQRPPRPNAKRLASMNAMKGPLQVLTASRAMA